MHAQEDTKEVVFVGSIVCIIRVRSSSVRSFCSNAMPSMALFFLFQMRCKRSMYAFVNSLNDKDIEDISRYYASLKPQACQNKSKDLTRGKEIYTRGDLNKHITACIACHGPDGAGNAQAIFPLLYGQKPNYTLSQLKAFKEKKRNNDINGIMHDISKRMSADDMRAVAEYICSF